jgi:P-type Cu+ transporter
MVTTQTNFQLEISGMTCASCVRRVERGLSKVQGVDAANVNFATEKAYVTAGDNVQVADLVAAVEKAGYGAKVAAPAGAAPAEHPEQRRILYTLIFGAVLGIPTVVLSMAMDIADLVVLGDEQLHRWLLLLLATPVQFVLGWRYYTGSWTSLRHFNPNMDVLIAMGTTIAWAFSAWVVVFNQDYSMYFDVSVTVLVLVTLGKLLEEQSKRAAGAAVQSLIGLSAKSASVVRDDREIELPVEEIALDEVFVVRPGDRVAVDGIVSDGFSSIDESIISGESLPVDKRPGDRVIGGTINQSGVVQVRATAVGSDTALARMVRMVEEAQGSKAPIQRLVDRIAAVFVPAVLAIAALTFVGWLLFGDGEDAAIDAMVATVAVLVIACPCAMGLATPTAIMVGIGIGADRGILIKNAEVLERTKSLDAVVLDKTGTLTEGRPQVVEVVSLGALSNDEVLRLAASVEQYSEHPLSRAIVDASVDRGLSLDDARDFRAVAGQGVVGTVAGRVLAVGKPGFAQDKQEAAADADRVITRLQAGGSTTIVLAIDGAPAGVIAIADELKPSARRAVEALRSRGLRVVMMTGDNEAVAARVASQANIDEFRANAMPEDKLALVRALQAEGLSVAMVGDGVNDAPALAQAEIGIAMSTGTDVAIEAGDITLLHGDVSKVAEAIALSHSTLTTIKQNLAWAFGYNALAIPVAAAGLLTPIVAGGAMAFSSVSVVLNSLRLRSQARRIAERSGNPYTEPSSSFFSTNRAPLAAVMAAALAVVVPLVVFVSIGSGWL